MSKNNVKIKIFKKLVLLILNAYVLYSVKRFIEYKISKLKVCICTLGKEENRYITEFVEYYKNYGIDKIYLYDNNDINGEKFENVIGKYINNKFVEIINWRGIKESSTYYNIMDSCYQANHDKYDWLIFYEIDEFLYLRNYKNVKNFLSNKKFNDCESIRLNWVHMSDNNHIFYENKPLSERFTEKGKNVAYHHKNKICYVKTIIRGHLQNIKINQNHLLSDKIKGCDGFGKKNQLKGIMSVNPDYNFNYIKHYFGKSVQEFVEKINRGDLLRGNSKNIVKWAIEKFFYINKITSEKIQYIQKNLGLKYNLSYYMEKLDKRI